MPRKSTGPRITAKQEGGDDGYCWAVRVNGALFVNGLTRREVPYYKERARKLYEEGNRPAATDGEDS